MNVPFRRGIVVADEYLVTCCGGCWGSELPDKPYHQPNLSKLAHLFVEQVGISTHLSPYSYLRTPSEVVLFSGGAWLCHYPSSTVRSLSFLLFTQVFGQSDALACPSRLACWSVARSVAACCLHVSSAQHPPTRMPFGSLSVGLGVKQACLLVLLGAVAVVVV